MICDNCKSTICEIKNCEATGIKRKMINPLKDVTEMYLCDKHTDHPHGVNLIDGEWIVGFDPSKPDGV
jgi:hypothetical protein